MLHVNIRGSFGDGGFAGGFGSIFLRVCGPITTQALVQRALPPVHVPGYLGTYNNNPTLEGWTMDNFMMAS
jgi:hypothetical protein